MPAGEDSGDPLWYSTTSNGAADKKNQVDFYSRRFVGTNLENPSVSAVAASLGTEGLSVDKLSDVGPALRAACEAQKEGKTTVLEMMVTRELGDPFRREALSKPVRFLEQYKECVESLAERVAKHGGVDLHVRFSAP